MFGYGEETKPPNSEAAAQPGGALGGTAWGGGASPLPSAPRPVTLQGPQAPVRCQPPCLGLGPSLCVGANVFLLYLKTETLTCNDAVFLQGLLPADLERRVQDLRETQVSHRSRF